MTETFRIRDPEDLLAVVPVVLGFHPTDSLVMLTFPTRARAFHARVDLPPDERGRHEMADSLLDAALRNDVDRVAFVAYADDARTARDVLFIAHDAFDAADLDVIDLLWAHPPTWVSLVSDREGTFDAGCHPFAVRAIVEGRVTRASRADLEATLRPVPERVAACRAAAMGLEEQASDAHWAIGTVRSQVTGGALLDDAEAARLLRSLGDDDVWQALWLLPRRDDARAHAELWADLLRRSPQEWAAPAAALLAHTAWLSGDGALAWCAVDRCRGDGAGHSGAELVAELLTRVVSPSEWEASLREPA